MTLDNLDNPEAAIVAIQWLKKHLPTWLEKNNVVITGVRFNERNQIEIMTSNGQKFISNPLDASVLCPEFRVRQEVLEYKCGARWIKLYDFRKLVRGSGPYPVAVKATNGTSELTIQYNNEALASKVKTINFTGDLTVAETSAGSVTVNVGSQAAQGMTWHVVNTDTVMQAGHGYIVNALAPIDLTLPTTASAGNVIKIVDFGGNLFTVKQSAGQTLHFGVAKTTTGINGLISPKQQKSALELVCVYNNLEFLVASSVGNFILQ